MKRNKYYQSVILFLILFFPTLINAQGNYMKGYVVGQSDDTVRGFINYKNWPFNPGRVVFKQSLDSEAIIYKPLDITAFGVNNETYVAAIVKTEMSIKTGVSNLDHDAGLNFVTDTVFLEAIITGPKSLYRYKGFEDVENLYIKTDGEYNLLIYKKYIKTVNNTGTVVENNTYIGQLTVYLSDCPLVQSKLYGVAYSAKSLVKAFKSYYNCVDQEAIYSGDTKKSIPKFGILAGTTTTRPEFTGSGPD